MGDKGSKYSGTENYGSNKYIVQKINKYKAKKISNVLQNLTNIVQK